MERLNLLVALMLLSGPAASAGPVAGTSEEIVDRLQSRIDRASEQGNYSHVQALRLDLAHHYATTGAYALAARQYELMLASRPSRRERVAHFIDLGKMREADRDYGRAIAAYQDALHDDTDNWDASLSLARAYDRSELNSKAIDVYKRCIALRPNAYEAYEGIAQVYKQLGFLNKAVLNYQKSLSIQRRPETYLALSDAYVRQGDVASAKDILQQAKAILPRADYDVRLGEIYRRNGELRPACKAWEEAIRIDARRDDVRLQLALVYDHLNRVADSDRMFRQLLVTYPNSPLVHYSRAWVLFARGEFDAARREAQNVEQLAPTAVVRHYNDKLLELLQKRS